jgi:type IV pilus assembly protein PilB
MLINAGKQLAQEWGYTYLDIDTLEESAITLAKIPLTLVEKHRFIICWHNQLIISDPAQLEHLQEIFFSLGESCSIAITDQSKLDNKIASILHQHERAALNDDASIVQYVEKLCQLAINKKASDIHLEAHGQYLTVRFRIDGLLYEIEKLSNHYSSRIIAHLKILAQLDTTEKRLPQDGRIRIAFQQFSSQKNFIDCRISTCPTLHDEKIVLRLLNNQPHSLEVDLLGLTANQKKSLLTLLEKPKGMMLVTGPTGSGKTVTLYTALNILNKSVVNILTVEDPVEIELLGVNQVQINHKIDLSFSKTLRSFLRQDPDIIMVGEMRDKETADIAIKAAQTGHLVLSTLHTNSAAETLTRLINMGIPSYDIAASVSLIISQRLVRKLCNHCKCKDILSDYFTAKGCAYCQDGYDGRVGIYEFLVVTPQLSHFILKQKIPNIIELEQKAKEEGMISLYDNGLEKVKAGMTSLSELSRVI